MQVSGVQQTPLSQTPEHDPQSRVPPHPSEIVPQLAPAAEQDVATQSFFQKKKWNFQ